jgi:polyisoprenoid-binding protein YceI
MPVQEQSRPSLSRLRRTLELRRAVTTVSLVLIATTVACKQAPTEKKALAEVGAALAISATPVDAVSYAFSANGSQIEFVGAKVTGKHSGSFTSFTGNVAVSGTSTEKSQVTVEIDMASMVADNPKLTEHLKSADLFDVAKFPKSRFISSSVTPGGQAGSHTVTGNLELHGVTKAITFPITLSSTPDSVSVDADFGINRQEFGVKYPGMPDDLIKDEIRLKLKIQAKRVAK